MLNIGRYDRKARRSGPFSEVAGHTNNNSLPGRIIASWRQTGTRRGAEAHDPKTAPTRQAAAGRPGRARRGDPAVPGRTFPPPRGRVDGNDRGARPADRRPARVVVALTFRSRRGSRCIRDEARLHARVVRGAGAGLRISVSERTWNRGGAAPVGLLARPDRAVRGFPCAGARLAAKPRQVGPDRDRRPPTGRRVRDPEPERTRRGDPNRKDDRGGCGKRRSRLLRDEGDHRPPRADDRRQAAVRRRRLPERGRSVTGGLGFGERNRDLRRPCDRDRRQSRRLLRRISLAGRPGRRRRSVETRSPGRLRGIRPQAVRPRLSKAAAGVGGDAGRSRRWQIRGPGFRHPWSNARPPGSGRPRMPSSFAFSRAWSRTTSSCSAATPKRSSTSSDAAYPAMTLWATKRSPASLRPSGDCHRSRRSA